MTRLLVVLILLASVSVADAQERGTRAIAGTVADSVTGRVLVDAEAFFGAGRGLAESDREGRFTVVASEQDSIMVVRRVGSPGTELEFAL